MDIPAQLFTHRKPARQAGGVLRRQQARAQVGCLLRGLSLTRIVRR